MSWPGSWVLVVVVVVGAILSYSSCQTEPPSSSSSSAVNPLAAPHPGPAPPTPPSWCHVRPQKTLPGTGRILLEHPVLDAKLGFVPGTTYSVIVSVEDGSSGFDGFVVRSEVGGAPFGSFVDLPDHGEHCSDVASVAYSFAGDARNNATVNWRGDTGAKDTCVEFLASIRSMGSWFATSTIVCKQEADCYKTFADRYGTITQDSVMKSIPSCSIVTIIFQFPSHERIFVQFQHVNLSAKAESDCSTGEYMETYVDPSKPPQRICGVTKPDMPKPDMTKSLNFASVFNYLIIKAKLTVNSIFKAVYYTLDKRKGCNRTLTSRRGYVTSPNFPGEYFPNLDCSVVISVPAGQKVALHVRSFRLQEPSEDGVCKHDYLKITGRKSESPSGDRVIRDVEEVQLCGVMKGDSPWLREQLFDSDIILHLHTDHLVETQGFSVTFEQRDPCRNETLTAQNGRLFFTAINVDRFGKSLTDVRDCYVIVHVPLGYVIEINVTTANTTPNTQSHSLSSTTPVTPISHHPNCTSFPILEITDANTSWVKCAGLHRHHHSGIHNARSDNLTVTTFLSSGNLVRARLIGDSSDSGLVVTYRAVVVNRAFTTGCNYGWVSSDSYCYSFEFEPMPWLEAEETCKSKGGHLVSVSSVQVQRLLEEIVKSSAYYTDDLSVWIGGNDRAYENCYEWSDGRPFTYTNWFPGWHQSNFYNAQPNDDGLASQDCVEIRRNFRFATKGEGLSETFFWNDRDCRHANPFLCSILKPGVTLEPYPPECNRSISLSSERHKEVITSPAYPDPYPPSVHCITAIHAPPGDRLQITFTIFMLEQDDDCRYDYVEISEPSGQGVKRCGDWSSRLKLLRYESQGSVVHVRFVSDYSHAFSGFRADIVLHQGNDLCDDERLRPFGDYCYLFVSYPEVTWHTARKICAELQGHLASVWSQSEQNFLLEHIRRMEAYTTGTLFWLGGLYKSSQQSWQWVDESVFNYTDWYPGWSVETNVASRSRLASSGEQRCLAAQWKSVKDSSGRLKYSGLYWESQACDQFGGYICKQERLVIKDNLNQTIYGLKGNLTSPNFPHAYANNLQQSVHLVGPSRTRILLQFVHLDLEWQENCLYDHVALRSFQDAEPARICGQHSTNLERFDYVSTKNELFATFYSDYCITGAGFDAVWTAVDISSCPSHIINMAAGSLESVHFPHGYIGPLECDTEITVAKGRRIWIQFGTFDVGNVLPKDASCLDDFLQVVLGGSANRTLNLCGRLDQLQFLTYGNNLRLRFHAGARKTIHVGYAAKFRAVDLLEEMTVIYLRTNGSGFVYNLNHPLPSPKNVNFSRKLVAPLGHVIQVHVYLALLLDDWNMTCPNIVVEVKDGYSPDSHAWRLCIASGDALFTGITLGSTYNTLHLRELTSSAGPVTGFEMAYTVVKDLEFLNKTLVLPESDMWVESCQPNPCVNGGVCEKGRGRYRCKCKGHYSGLFCHVTKCQPDPCAFGTCNLTPNGFTCVCDAGYSGKLCDEKLTPCSSNPCGENGRCIDNNETFVCQCHAWWEGSQCKRQVFRIPYKPLSRRMLKEPFWLGLITVTVVLIVLGCVWCIKRKFADKFERFLAEEIERSKQNQQRNRSASLSKLGRAGTRGVETVVSSSGGTGVGSASCSPQAAPRSLLGRLGRRKHSMLHFVDGGNNAGPPHQPDSRSFSFDDLLRRGSPKRRPPGNGSTSGGTAAVAPEERTKEILQALVSPVPKLHRRMSLEEFINLSEQKIKDGSSDSSIAKLPEAGMEETSFYSPLDRENPRVLKKKVSFAKCVESAASALAAVTPELILKQQVVVVDDDDDDDLTTDSEKSVGTALMSLLRRQEAEEVTTSTDETSRTTENEHATFMLTTSSSSSSSSPEMPCRVQKRLPHVAPSSPVVVVVHEPPPTPPVESPPRPPKIEDVEETKEEEVPKNATTLEIPTIEQNGRNQKIGDSTTVFRCLETLTPEALADKLPLGSGFVPLPAPRVPLITIPVSEKSDPLEKEKEELEKMVDPKVHAIDDLAEALEKKRHQELAVPQPMQIPIFSMFDAPQLPYRKGSLETASLRVPENIPRKLSVDGAVPFAPPPLGFALAAKTPQGIPLYQMVSPVMSSEAGGQTRSRPKPAPLQLLQREGSLDAPPPIITITSSMSSCDSDTDSPVKAAVGGVPYVGPFVLVGAAPTDDMNTSLSNLSSSGYSSMASPIPSRCSSNNPLCPSSENEQDPPTPRQPTFKPFTRAGFLCPPMAAMAPVRAPRQWPGDRASPSASSREVSPPSDKSSPIRKRSSSETTTDGDAGLAEADEPPELPVKDPGPNPPITSSSLPLRPRLPPPIIVVHEGSDVEGPPTGRRDHHPLPSPSNGLTTSPSPQLPDKNRMLTTRPSLLLTDSDSVYDCASSEVPGSHAAQRSTPRRQGRRRERPHMPSKHKRSPLLAARRQGGREHSLPSAGANRRMSPKRRPRQQLLALDADESSADSGSSSSSGGSSPGSQESRVLLYSPTRSAAVRSGTKRRPYTLLRTDSPGRHAQRLERQKASRMEDDDDEDRPPRQCSLTGHQNTDRHTTGPTSKYADYPAHTYRYDDEDDRSRDEDSLV